MALTFDLIYASLKEENAALRKVYTEQQALIRQLVEALNAAVLQNDCDMVMTGEELRQARSAIALGRARLEGKP